LVIAFAVAAIHCGERTIKTAGQECSATSECETGLLCDFASEPPVCAGESSGPPPMDEPDAAPMIDAAAIDAAP